MAPPPRLTLEERFPTDELNAAQALSVEDLHRQYIETSDRVAAIVRKDGWWRTPGVSASVFRSLRFCELARALLPRTAGGSCAPKALAEASVLLTQEENENGYWQDCVVAYCLDPDGQPDEDEDAAVGRAWGHGERSVYRALKELGRACACGALVHERAR